MKRIDLSPDVEEIVGLATLCIDVGQGAAMLIKRV